MPRALLILLLLISITACSYLPVNFGGPKPTISPQAMAATPAGGSSATLAANSTQVTLGTAVVDLNPVNATTIATSHASTLSVPATLTLWVPPRFDPSHADKAAGLLRSRVAAFEKQNSVTVVVRVKEESGPGGLLDALSASTDAAPLTLPSVIALPRSDLETAAQRGLIQPLDGLSTVINEPDWYTYARDLAMVQGAPYSLPFAGDALMLAYRPSKVVGFPSDWDAILRIGQPLSFAAGDGQALFTLALYTSLNGQLEDAQRRPTLQPDVLAKVLTIISQGEQRGLFPYWLSQFETYTQTMQAYKDGRVNSMVVWASSLLFSPDEDTAPLPLPALGSGSSTLATAWGWAVADPLPARRTLATRLAEFLSAGDFLASWTEAAGYLPTRPSALAGWSSDTLKTLYSPVAVSARARPSSDLLAELGPVLKDATLSVLKKEADPTKAAQTAANRLSTPQTP